MSSETLRTPLAAELDAFFRQYTEADQAKGLVYGHATAEGLSHSRGFGVANDDGLEPDADTVFPIASMTKSFVACAALVARDRGLLSLDDPITAWFPDFAGAGATEDPCDPPTMRMLFSMSGGLTEDNSWIDPFIHMDETELLRQLKDGVRYSHSPGSTYEYSNLGYALAGLAVGRAVGRPIEEFVHDEVLVPLGLTRTFFDNAAPAGIDRATGYSLDVEGRWTPFAPTASAAFAAAGGMMSTVRDLATWMTWLGAAFRAPRADGHGDHDEVLSRASRRELQRLHIVDPPVLSMRSNGGLQANLGGYALGLRVSQDLWRGTVVSHGGGLPGFTLFMCWHPDSGNATVVLTNSHRGDPATLCRDALGRALARDEVAAQTIVLWQETADLRAEVESLIRAWDDEVAARVFAPNVDFDRPLVQRRAELERLVDEIGPLGAPRPLADIVSAATPADVTWSVPGEHGELICMIHLTPINPAQVQEFVVEAVPFGRPRSASPDDVSPRRSGLGPAFIGTMPNVRVLLP